MNTIATAISAIMNSIGLSSQANAQRATANAQARQNTSLYRTIPLALLAVVAIFVITKKQ